MSTTTTTPTPTTAPWRTDEPPQDGTPIVAIGKVMYDDEGCTVAQPFVAAITWGSTRFQDIKTGWHFWQDGMSVPSTTEDKVIIHQWLPMPE